MAMNPTLLLPAIRLRSSEPRFPNCEWRSPKVRETSMSRAQAALREWQPLMSLWLDSFSYMVTSCHEGEAEVPWEPPVEALMVASG